MKVWVGVDVSKLTLDICWEKEGHSMHLKVTNALDGYQELLSLLPKEAHVVMEATGAYSFSLAHFLLEKGVAVSVVNPISIKRYAQMKLARAKTDKYDAALIAGYGASQNPPLWKVPEAQILELQQLCALEEQLLANKGALVNQLEAFSKNPFASPHALQFLADRIRLYEKDLKDLEKRIQSLAREHYPRPMEILLSIPGMGKKTAVALLVATKAFRDTINGRALCSYVGIAPRPYQSGTSVRAKGRISKMGNKSLRNKLYMCAMTAIRSNEACKVFYTRLRKNAKPAKVALIAVASKLLRQAAAMVKANQLFDEKLALGT
jgi:transposase